MKKVHESWDDRLFMIGVRFFLFLAVAITLYPLYYVLIASFSDPKMVYGGQVILWPRGLTFKAYTTLAKNDTLMTGYANSLLYTVVGTSISVYFTMIAGFGLAQKFRGRGGVLTLFTITMFFSGGLIPSYLLIKSLGLMNTMWALIFSGGAVSIWNLLIVRNFYLRSIPRELQEAAIVDGASLATYYYQIALPLSRAILSVMVLYYALGYWNMYFKALIYLSDEHKFPLQLILRSILLENQLPEEGDMDVGSVVAAKQQLADLLKFSSVVAGSLPLLIAYPFLQKYFEKGIMIGSIKG